ncbi:MAG TPA: hypothetical protein VF177_10200, partial [Anaerolineae bacterium]
GSDDITITFSADLTAAEVTWLESFAVSAAEQVTQSVMLQQMAIYRHGARSWLLSPPEREFWGEWEQVEGAYTTLVYPGRDEQIARRLVHDLDAIIVRVCRQLEGVTCPAGLRLRLRLSTDAESLLAVQDAEQMIMSGRSLSLPAPTLAGLPLDEAGYQALVRGYAVHVVSALITDLVDYECCRNGLLYRALLDKQLSQLGLRPWPLTQAGYEQLLAQPGGLRLDVGSLQIKPSLLLPAAAKWLPLYSLVDFLLADAALQTSVADLQRTLAGPLNFSGWLNQVTRERYTPDRFNAAWLQFVYEQTPSAHIELPVPLPDQDLQLVCTERNQGVWLYRYSWDTGNWTEVFGRGYEDINTAGYIYPLPGGRGHVLQEHFFSAGQRETRLSLWKDGREAMVLEPGSGATSSTYFLFYDSDTSGRYLILATFGDGYRVTGYELLDLATCSNGQCERWALAGQPLWSPDGAQTLLLGEPPIVETDVAAENDPWQAPLYRGDAQGQSAVAVGSGLGPFWLDNNTYGYLRRTGGKQVELVTAVAGDDTPHVVLRAADLLPHITSASRLDVIIADRVLANPADPRQLLGIARPAGEEGNNITTVFLLDLAADFHSVDEIIPVLQAVRPAWGHFSPDGRWLVVAVWNTNGRDSIFHLIDLESYERQTFSSSGYGLVWSAEGQWLAQVEEDYLLLRAPAYEYKQLILHDFSDCYSVYWVEKGDQRKGIRD